MKTEIDINEFIDNAADEYVSLRKRLRKNNLTFEKAEHDMKKYRQKFYEIIQKYRIGNVSDFVMASAENKHNADLQYLYAMTITDKGLLISDDAERTMEQDITCYIEQSEKAEKLFVFIQKQSENKLRLDNILSNSEEMHNYNYDKDELNDLYKMTLQHRFIFSEREDEVYRDNLQSLLEHINSGIGMKTLKPYILFAILSRKHGLITRRENYIPDIRLAFHFQEYNIWQDNGKNFDVYASYIELYYQLREYYMDEDVDIELCDFCFANYSLLSTWYYENCEINEEIPMNFLTATLMNMSLNFISWCDESNNYDKIKEIGENLI